MIKFNINDYIYVQITIHTNILIDIKPKEDGRLAKKSK